MTVECGTPDAGLGVALRVSGYLDCQARALGENGFQAMVGGPLAAGLLGGVVTLFVALIGYRLMLGRRVDAADAVGWTVRLGIVLALVTGWPAFQTLIYRVAVDGPGELSRTVLPAAGLPSEAIDGRVQAAYDTIRLGGSVAAARAATDDEPGTPAVADRQAARAAAPGGPVGLGAGQLPRPTTALVLVVSTVGVASAFRIAVGILLAVAPLAIMALLFDATLGLFAGWAGVLAGAALAVLATTVVTALELVVLEGEIGRVQAYSRGMVAASIDPEAIPVIVVLFGLASLVAATVAGRLGAALRIYASRAATVAVAPAHAVTGNPIRRPNEDRARPAVLSDAVGTAHAPTRATLLAGAIGDAVRHERAAPYEGGAGGGDRRRDGRAVAVPGEAVPTGYGAAGRRLTARRTRSGATRDMAR